MAENLGDWESSTHPVRHRTGYVEELFGVRYVRSRNNMISIKRATVALAESTSSNLDVPPMEFFSADGRINMMLQPVTEKTKRKQPKVAPATEEYTVPKQLQSSTRLKTIENPRAKFSTNFTIFDNSIDLSGIFTGNSMKKRDLSKLVINGKSYST